MNKFYLNHYKWLELVIAGAFSVIMFFVIQYSTCSNALVIIKKVISASESLFGAIASLLGFVFATVTILVGLGDNYRSNENSNFLVSIIERLSLRNKESLSLEETKKIKNKHTASSVFFNTEAYSMTLNSLLGCVRILAVVFIFSLVVSVFANNKIYWAVFITFYLSMALLSIVRLLIIVKFLIRILTSDEKSDK